MINVKNVKYYCCEDPSLIENYDKAVADQTQTWHCHHRKETDDGLSVDELIKMGLYWKRPACELIYIPSSEHTRVHWKGKTTWMKGKHHTEEAKAKSSEAHKGKIPWNKGKETPQETREKISNSVSGEKNPMYGTHRSKDTKAKISESQPNKKAIYQIDKNSGIIIKEWKTIAEAAKTLKIRNIIGCCKGYRKSAGGYIWRYVDIH